VGVVVTPILLVKLAVFFGLSRTIKTGVDLSETVMGGHVFGIDVQGLLVVIGGSI
jgi:hypothetical protein